MNACGRAARLAASLVVLSARDLARETGVAELAVGTELAGLSRDCGSGPAGSRGTSRRRAERPYTGGFVGLYTEDAEVEFRDISVLVRP